ncbi:hypothetical protein AB0L57_06510 [Nocardia sp. NPDC052254]|uniref:hypothetical protein n=1 Tax=Nocardia sp. NPDC052254 TaxID=3155681 RepID=UPI00342E4244
MSDDASCFIDYTTWIDRDPAQPARVVGHIRPLNTRATIPGLPAPAHCSVTLVDTTLTDLDILGHPTAPGGPDAPMFGLLGEAVHIDSGPAGGAAAEVTLPYQPNASAVAVRFMPQAMLYPIFGAYVAQPLIGPSTAFDLH